MALDMRIAVSGKLFDGGMQGVHHLWRSSVFALDLRIYKLVRHRTGDERFCCRDIVRCRRPLDGRR
jgi:hypothetical protein